MFEAPRSQMPGQFDLPVAPTKTLRPPPRRTRLLKIGVAAGLLGAALYAVTAGQATVTSSNAVLSAYTVSLRAPIAGEFRGEGLRVGDAVSAGDNLGRIDDALVDGQGIEDLTGQIARSEAEGRALVRQRSDLLGMRARLVDRVTDVRAVEEAFQDRDLEIQDQRLRALSARNRALRRALERRETLARDGFAPTSEAEDLVDDVESSDAETAAQDAVVARTRIRLAAAGRGLFLGEGMNGASYSMQRIDEVDVRLSEIERSIASSASAGVEARRRLVVERDRLALLSEAVLRAPSAGTVWRIGASDGERLGVGDAAFELVDCETAFILAAIPQDRFGDVAIGGMARFRLSGERMDRQGRVLGVMASSDPAGDRNLAAAPAPGHGDTVLARIDVPSHTGPCAVGRTARVLLPVDAGHGPVARLTGWIFG